ncbi:MAG: CPBP family intramembrane metalloprotease [Planctomycetes bacterium]|nr:CPBP family intramembrane metalloprotease [Planctomycetota bacterium]
MSPHEPTDDDFWNTTAGLIIQLFLVLLPSAILMSAGKWLLLGLSGSVLISLYFVRAQRTDCRELGLARPKNRLRVLIISVGVALFLMPVTLVMKHGLSRYFGARPNLDEFKAIEGNLPALLAGLAVAWVFGAFLEEFLLRGYMLSRLLRLFGGFGFKTWEWPASLSVMSILAGLGHTYQGIAGMVMTALISFVFGCVYWMSGRNLWISIFAHGIYNTTAFIFLFLGINTEALLAERLS